MTSETYDAVYANAIEAGYSEEEAIEMAAQASWDDQHDAAKED